LVEITLIKLIILQFLDLSAYRHHCLNDDATAQRCRCSLPFR
jgi:hypothetical protein